MHHETLSTHQPQQSENCPVSAIAGPAREIVCRQRSGKHGHQDLDDGGVDDPIGDRRACDRPGFGIMNVENIEAIRTPGAGRELRSEAQELLFSAKQKPSHVSASAFATDGQVGSAIQSFRVAELGVKTSYGTHGRLDGKHSSTADRGRARLGCLERLAGIGR